jgi:nucleoside-diphosphate-sugar epimerase
MNLVLGSTSQLSRYFPDNYAKVSARELDLDALTKTRWDAVYICFAEQRTYLANAIDENTRNMFWNTNVDKTLQIIERLQEVTDKIVYYSTAELWNNTSGPVKVTDPVSFHKNNYTESKWHITQILRDKEKYPKVSILYPFNFNSIHRGDQYLFGKIFKSIVNKQPVTIGDVQYYRELLHPQMVVDASINATAGVDEIVGSGRVVYVKDFIELLYMYSGLSYNDMITEDNTKESIYRKNIFYSALRNEQYDVDRLIDLTLNELTNPAVTQ